MLLLVVVELHLLLWDVVELTCTSISGALALLASTHALGVLLELVEVAAELGHTLGVDQVVLPLLAAIGKALNGLRGGLACSALLLLLSLEALAVLERHTAARTARALTTLGLLGGRLEWAR